MPTPPVQPPPGQAGQTSADRIAQLQQSGFTGQMINPATGQMQQMNNGAWVSAPAAPPAQGAQTPANVNGAGAAPGPQGDPTGLAGYLGNVGPNTGPTGMAPWQSWMASGGVNPAGWQGLGGGPDLSFLSQFQGMLANGANPTQVDPTSASSLFGAAQPYMDTAYQQSMRELQPQIDQQNSTFDQQMINQGIAPGTAAYEQARTQLSQQQNDATAQARAQAQQQGLAAQAQGFGQGLSQSQLASTLAGQLLGSNTSLSNQMLGGNASIMNQLLGGNSGIAQQIIGAQAQRDAANASASASRANAGMNYRLGEDQLALQGQNSDFANLLSLAGLGMGTTQYNNGLLDQNQRNAMQFLGFLPEGGSGSIDAQSPYNNYYNGQMNGWNYNNQQANATNSEVMSAAMMAYMMCDREIKEPVETFSISATDVIRTLPVEHWKYKGHMGTFLGTYAQDFNKAIGVGGEKVIQLINMLGFLLKLGQEQTARLDRIENMLRTA